MSSGILTISSGFNLAFLGMIEPGTGMGIQNEAMFELVSVYILDAMGVCSGWIAELGGAGTLLIIQVLGFFTDYLGPINYACKVNIFV